MTVKVFYHLLSMAEKAMPPYREVATGGNTTTVTVANMTDAPYDDYFNGGTLFFLTGDEAEKAYVITNWVQSTKTATFSPTAPTGASANDEVILFPGDWTLNEMYRALNEVISELPPVDKLYEAAAYVTVANQAAYDLPTNGWEIVGVEVAGSQTSPYNYSESLHWYRINDGTNDQVIFIPGAVPTSAGYRIRLRYRDYPDKVDSYTDLLSDWYDIDWSGWAGAEKLLHWRMKKTGGQDPMVAQDHAYALQQLAIQQAKHEKKIPRRRIVEKASPWAAVGN